MQDAWRAYLEMALGLTEAPRKKAQKVAGELLNKGGATAGQLQGLVEDLLSTGVANREALTNIVRYEVDRALGLVGLATADEVVRPDHPGPRPGEAAPGGQARAAAAASRRRRPRPDVTLAEPGNPAAVDGPGEAGRRGRDPPRRRPCQEGGRQEGGRSPSPRTRCRPRAAPRPRPRGEAAKAAREVSARRPAATRPTPGERTAAAPRPRR